MKQLKLISILLLCASCYHDSPQPRSNAFLIAGDDAFGKTWNISHIEIELGTVTPHKCLTDNFITYFPNGKYEINEGASKCDPYDPPAVTGSWELDSRETQIFVEIGDSLQVWYIEVLNAETHKISSQFQEGERIYSLSTINDH